ncbi:MSHA biogenesis protein MshK [Tamilnaduibacter salinus]|uniref:MSHA biogenesis protein MshK n=1 Tax=Tamilnaduibacter salinus TaxID=1484056 RepID=A0A2U1CTX8_9GAMM|nr:general secretion pathway protein GspB [Tamilnaduibacter salinus]PVY70310.1 MSHA biogenesis protein MshK [Tamilnaduibacter salinus]
MTRKLLLILMVMAGPALALKDPTRPAGTSAPVDAKPTRTSLSLTSIIQAGERRRAVINGQVVREGDPVAGTQVLSIDSDRVILRQGGKRRVLRWQGPPDIKTTP